MNAKPRKNKPLRFYFRVARLVDPNTGEEIGCLVPLTKWDARSMRARKYHVGTVLRAELKNPRNVLFHRLAHAIGALVAEQLEDFEGLDAHAALKKLQVESGAACETVEYELPGGITIKRVEPRSLSFDEMDEGEFQQAIAIIYRYLQRKYWPSMTEEAVALMVEMYERDH